MIDTLSVAPPNCDPHYDGLSNGNCGSYVNACIFMCLYIFVVPLVLMNLYVAIVLENFKQAGNQEEIDFDEVDYEEFYDHWAQYDTEAVEFISYRQSIDFIRTLKGKLAIPDVTPKIMKKMHIPLYEGNLVHCVDILHELLRYHRTLKGHYKEEEHSATVTRTIQAAFRKKFPILKRMNITSSIGQRQMEERAAALIQQKFREFVGRRLRQKRTRRVKRSGSPCQDDHFEFVDLAGALYDLKEGASRQGGSA